MPEARGRVLIIAGSDSSGGAGIQADIKTVTALGGYAATAITAITVQNTLGVSAVHAVPIDIIRGQIDAVLSDIGADAAKTGMLGSSAIVEATVQGLAPYPDLPLVVDPVMRAKGGAALLDHKAAQALRSLLLPRAAIITPNIPEAEQLTGFAIKSEADMRRAGEKLCADGARAALIKGGHADGPIVVDLLVADGTVQRFENPRIKTRHTHGTGCTLASAIAVSLAQGLALPPAVARAISYVQQAIRAAPGFGKGHGPLGHAHTLRGPDSALT